MKSRHDEIRKKYGKGGWNVHIRWVWSGADAALGAGSASLVHPPRWAAGQLGVLRVAWDERAHECLGR